MQMYISHPAVPIGSGCLPGVSPVPTPLAGWVGYASPWVPLVPAPLGTELVAVALRDEGFPGGSVVTNPPANAGDAGDAGLIPGSGRSPGGGNGNPLQYSCLGNPMDRGAWRAIVHGVAEESDTAEGFNNNNKRNKVMDGSLQDRQQACLFPASKRWIPTPGEPARTPQPPLQGQPLGCSCYPRDAQGGDKGAEAGLAVFCGTNHGPPKLTSSSSEHASKWSARKEIATKSQSPGEAHRLGGDSLCVHRQSQGPAAFSTEIDSASQGRLVYSKAGVLFHVSGRQTVW